MTLILIVYSGKYTWAFNTHPLVRLQRVKNVKETARYKWVLVVTELSNIAVNVF